MATKKKSQEQKQSPNQPIIVRQVEQHIVKLGNPRYTRLDEVSFATKNLYNLVNYHIRQAFIHDHHYLAMKELWPIIKSTDAYQHSLAKYPTRFSGRFTGRGSLIMKPSRFGG